jgi:hypothetical protein
VHYAADRTNRATNSARCSSANLRLVVHCCICTCALLQRCVALVDDMQARGIARTPEVYTAAMYACKEVTNNFNHFVALRSC